MPKNIYTVEYNGHEYDIEGDVPPTEADVRALIGSAGPRGLSADPTDREAQRQANMAAQSGIVTDYETAHNASLNDTLSRAASGVVRGAASIFDPRTYIETARTAVDSVFPTVEGVKRNMDRGKAFGMMLKNVVSGDPDAGGEAIGQLATGLVLPRVAPKVPGAMLKTGEVMEAVGKSPVTKTLTKTGGVIMGIEHGAPGGVALAASPYAVEAGGRMLQKGAKALGASKSRIVPPGVKLVKPEPVPAEAPLADMLDEARGLSPNDPALSVELPPSRTLTPEGRPSITPDETRPTNPHMRQTGKSSGAPESDYAPKPMMPVPVKPNPNAGGRLVTAPSKVSAEDALAEAVQSANTPAREVVDVETSTPNPLEQAGRFAGKDIDFYRRRPGAQPATPATPVPAEVPVEAPVDPALVKSELQKQLEASLDQAGLKKAEGVTKSRSRGSQGEGSQPSATPGLTRNDVEALGLNPDEPITHLTQAMMDKLLEARAARASRYYSEGVSEAAAKRSLARGK